jgi:hypothetical protein
MHGHTVDELSHRFGHQICRLTERARQLGLTFDDEDEEVFSLTIHSDAQMPARYLYLQTGFFRWASLPALDRTCKSLNRSVGEAFKKSGIPVRL